MNKEMQEHNKQAEQSTKIYSETGIHLDFKSEFWL